MSITAIPATIKALNKFQLLHSKLGQMIVGTALGIWIDTTWPSRFSWTLMLLMVGVILECLNAWEWINQENRCG